MSTASRPRTVQDVLWGLEYAQELEKKAQIELKEARSKVAEAMRLAKVELARIDSDEEAFEAFGRAYWLDEKGCICSVKLRQTYDLLIDEPRRDEEPVEPRLVRRLDELKGSAPARDEFGVDLAIRDHEGRIIAVRPGDPLGPATCEGDCGECVGGTPCDDHAKSLLDAC